MKYQGDKLNPSQFNRGQIKYFLILIPLAIVYALPIIYIFSTAFKPLTELFEYPPRFFVRKPTTENFRELISVLSSSTVPFGRYLINSVLTTIVVTVANVIISLYAGYTLAKKKFRYKKVINTINTMAMMFVPVAVTIPRFLVIRELGLLNTFFALVLPLIAMPVGLFLLVQYMSTVPDVLIEAARIDGASENYILFRIVAPLVKPAICTMSILAFQNAWNNTELSNLFVSNDWLRTFPYYISTLASNQGNTVAGAGIVAAATLVLFIPNLIVFILMQNNVMNTMAHSGIK
ncbi:carbohydrate ABC transporter permease [Ruminococcus sp. 2227st1_E6_2227SCRN_220401]|uniref:carbohydrate ABC transporter permease n=1 Tax=unclassified Ruminococcus TaxID=2608920 RepID=UPI00319DE316